MLIFRTWASCGISETISNFWAEHLFKDIFRMISHKHRVNKNLINPNSEIIYDIY